MDKKILELLIKQYKQCETPEVVAAIKEQEKLSQIMKNKKDMFDQYSLQSIDFLQKGTEKFFEKFPGYKELLSKGETKLEVIQNAIKLL